MKDLNHSFGRNRTLERLAGIQDRADIWARTIRNTFQEQGLDVLFLEGSILAVEAWCESERLWRECIRGTMAVREEDHRFIERLLSDHGFRFGPPPRDMNLLLATQRNRGRSTHALVDQAHPFAHDPRSMEGRQERGKFLREAVEPIQSYWHRQLNRDRENEPRLISECLGLRTTMNA